MLGIIGSAGFACGSSADSEYGFVSASSKGDLSSASVTRVAYDADVAEACGRGGVTATGNTELPRWPYLQKVTTNSAEVLFTSTLKRPYRVVAYTPDSEVRTEVEAVPEYEPSSSVGTHYVASLAGLPANTTVCYQLIAGDDVLTLATGFRTAPEASSRSMIRFVALGDLGQQSQDQYAVLEQLEQVPIDLAVFTGDLAYTHGTERELERNFFQVYRDLLGKVPAFPALGNHDYGTDAGRPFRDAFSLFTNGGPEAEERWYSFDWGPVHFVVLDTERLVPQQLGWLDADLASNDRPWTVAVAHRPPFSSGDHGSNAEVRAALSPIFVAHEVPLVLLGHEHNYERTNPIDGVVYVVTGGGGRGTRPVGRSPFTAFSERVAHFVWVEADAEEMRLVAIDGSGQAFDSVRFRQPS